MSIISSADLFVLPNSIAMSILARTLALWTGSVSSIIFVNKSSSSPGYFCFNLNLSAILVPPKPSRVVSDSSMLMSSTDLFILVFGKKVPALSASSKYSVLSFILPSTNWLSGSRWNIKSLEPSTISSISFCVNFKFLYLPVLPITLLTSFIASIGVNLLVMYSTISSTILLPTLVPFTNPGLISAIPPSAKGMSSSSGVGVLTSSVNIKVPSPTYFLSLTCKMSSPILDLKIDS